MSDLAIKAGIFLGWPLIVAMIVAVMILCLCVLVVCWPLVLFAKVGRDEKGEISLYFGSQP